MSGLGGSHDELAPRTPFWAGARQSVLQTPEIGWCIFCREGKVGRDVGLGREATEGAGGREHQVEAAPSRAEPFTTTDNRAAPHECPRICRLLYLRQQAHLADGPRLQSDETRWQVSRGLEGPGAGYRVPSSVRSLKQPRTPSRWPGRVRMNPGQTLCLSVPQNPRRSYSQPGLTGSFRTNGRTNAMPRQLVQLERNGQSELERHAIDRRVFPSARSNPVCAPLPPA